MDSFPPSAAGVLYERFGRYLQDDPDNPLLLADACDAAIAAGAHAQARAHIDVARTLGLEPSPWTLRRARVCLALRELHDARALLEQLRGEEFLLPVVVHNLAYVDFLEGNFSASVASLRPWMEPQKAPDPGPGCCQA